MVHVIRDIAACVPYYRFFQDGLAEYLLLRRLNPLFSRRFQIPVPETRDAFIGDSLTLGPEGTMARIYG
jgi:hypothetical protein